MEQPQLSVYHLVFALYIGYCHAANGKIIEEESVEIQKRCAKWFNVSFQNIHIFNQIMLEATNMYNGVKEPKEKYNFVMSIADQISKSEELNADTRKEILSDLRDIAVTDGLFSDPEKVLHDRIAKVFGTPITTIDEKADNKIGFS